MAATAIIRRFRLSFRAAVARIAPCGMLRTFRRAGILPAAGQASAPGKKRARRVVSGWRMVMGSAMRTGFVLLALLLLGAAAAAAKTRKDEVHFRAYVTGYSFWDNTPPGSGDISHPVLHAQAGGTGTYADPITLAVGHSFATGRDVLDYPRGTRFYIPALRRYFIVEDTCGNGARPQNGPCHTGHAGKPWLDIYVGKGASFGHADDCMNAITDVHAVIMNPAPHYPVAAGEITRDCRRYRD
jgi:hypothetical protein